MVSVAKPIDVSAGVAQRAAETDPIGALIEKAGEVSAQAGATVARALHALQTMTSSAPSQPESLPPARPVDSHPYFTPVDVKPVAAAVLRPVFGGLRATSERLKTKSSKLQPAEDVGWSTLHTFMTTCVRANDDPIARMWRDGLGRTGDLPKVLVFLTAPGTAYSHGQPREVAGGLYLTTPDQVNKSLLDVAPTWIRFELKSMSGRKRYVISNWGGDKADSLVGGFWVPTTKEGDEPLTAQRKHLGPDTIEADDGEEAKGKNWKAGKGKAQEVTVATRGTTEVKVVRVEVGNVATPEVSRAKVAEREVAKARTAEAATATATVQPVAVEAARVQAVAPAAVEVRATRSRTHDWVGLFRAVGQVGEQSLRWTDLMSHLRTAAEAHDDPIKRMWHDGLGNAGPSPEKVRLTFTKRGNDTDARLLRLTLVPLDGQAAPVMPAHEIDRHDGYVDLSLKQISDGKTAYRVDKFGGTGAPEVSQLLAQLLPDTLRAQSELGLALRHGADRVNGIRASMNDTAVEWSRFVGYLRDGVLIKQDPIMVLWAELAGEKAPPPDELVLIVTKSNPDGETAKATGIRLLTLPQEAELRSNGKLSAGIGTCRVLLALNPDAAGVERYTVSGVPAGAASPEVVGALTVSETPAESVVRRLDAALRTAEARGQGENTHVKTSLSWDEFVGHLRGEVAAKHDPIARMWQNGLGKGGELPGTLILFVDQSVDARSGTKVAQATGLRLVTPAEEHALKAKGLISDNNRLCRIELQLVSTEYGRRYAIASPNQKGSGSVEIIKVFSPITDAQDGGVARLLNATLQVTRNRRDGTGAAVRNDEPLGWNSLMDHWRAEVRSGRDPVASMWRDGLGNTEALPKHLVMIARNVATLQAGMKVDILGLMHLVTLEEEVALKASGKIPAHRQVSRVILQLTPQPNGQDRYVPMDKVFSGRGSGDVVDALTQAAEVVKPPVALRTFPLQELPAGQLGFVTMGMLASPLASGATLLVGKVVADLIVHHRLPKHWGQLTQDFAVMTAGSTVGTTAAKATLLWLGKGMTAAVQGGVVRVASLLGAVVLNKFMHHEDVKMKDVGMSVATVMAASGSVTMAIKVVKNVERMAGVFRWWSRARAASKVLSIGGGVGGVLLRTAAEMTVIELIDSKLRSSTFGSAAEAMHHPIRQIHDAIAQVRSGATSDEAQSAAIQLATQQLQSVVAGLDQVIQVMAEDGMSIESPAQVMPIPIEKDWKMIPSDDILDGVDLPDNINPTVSDSAKWKWFEFLSSHPVVLRQQLIRYIDELNKLN